MPASTPITKRRTFIPSSSMARVCVASCLGLVVFLLHGSQLASAAPDTAAAEQRSGFEWQFRSANAMADGTFTANAWKVGKLTHLVFRRKDHSGADRTTFLKGLQDKVLTIQYADTTLARVRIIATQDQGNDISLVCEKLSGSKDDWHWNVNELYAVRIDVPGGEPVPLAATPGNAPPVTIQPSVRVEPAAPVTPVAPAPAATRQVTPAPAATASVAPAEQPADGFQWRFRNAEAMQDGTFSANAWQMAELNKFVFRRLDHRGQDRSAFLLNLPGKTLLIREGNKVLVRAKIGALDDQGNQLYFDCQRIGVFEGLWRYNAVYTVQVEGSDNAPAAPAPAAPAVVAVDPRSVPAAGSVPAAADEKQPKHCFWRFRNAEQMQDGTFTANAWSVTELSELVFRPIDHEGQNRLAYLTGLTGKVLTIRHGDRTIAGVKVTSVKVEGNTVRLFCEPLVRERGSWQYDKVYVIQADDGSDAATRPTR